MKISDLFEARFGASLYHGTDFHSGIKIILDDTLKARTQHEIQGKTVRGVSLSRSPRVAKMFSGGIIFELDQEKLAQRHKILPIDFWHKTISRSMTAQNPLPEAEEFVVGNIGNLSRYIKKIWIDDYVARYIPEYDEVIQSVRDNPKIVYGSPYVKPEKHSLKEGRDAPLYHGTSFWNIPDIIRSNRILAKTYHNNTPTSKKDADGVSLTRNPRLAERYAVPGFVIQLDQSKISRDFKIFPHNFFRTPWQRDEFEEFVVGDIFPLDRYMTKLWCDPYIVSKKHFKEHMEANPFIMNHPLFIIGLPSSSRHYYRP